MYLWVWHCYFQVIILLLLCLHDKTRNGKCCKCVLLLIFTGFLCILFIFRTDHTAIWIMDLISKHYQQRMGTNTFVWWLTTAQNGFRLMKGQICSRGHTVCPQIGYKFEVPQRILTDQWREFINNVCITNNIALEHIRPHADQCWGVQCLSSTYHPRLTVWWRG